MSKESDLRAMREARWTARNSGAPAKAAAPRPTLARPPVAPPAAAEASASSADEALCGHKSMNGRTCTREAGHSAKSHRYS